MAKIDPRLRAEFREIAREIIGRDRDARKYGQSQNTIGEIERALAWAYKAGRDGLTIAAQHGPGEAYDWTLIPPRARDTLMKIGLDAASATREGRSFALMQLGPDARGRWVEIDSSADSKRSEGYASGGVAPLVRIGMLEATGPAGTLVLSSAGRATLDEFWRKWNAREPVLPRMSLR